MLVRSCEPLAGERLIRRRRGGLEVRAGAGANEIVVGPRVGIGHADAEHKDAEWRFAVAGSPWVSHIRQLRGMQR